ncbi:MAG: hypothetical protein MJZ43_02270 [Bacteroidaceae bacterium]|nr:hypothetical protein [Candidatus Equimonas faecalis]MCQ2205586.1 hypothetical protein [Bacteroidaceae bacterium]
MARRSKNPPGLALNNPVNVPYSDTLFFLGMVQQSPHRWGLIHFFNKDFGYRAAIRMMYLFMKDEGLRTPAEIIRRWGPVSDQRTPYYVAAACAYAGLDPDEPMEPMSIEMLQLVSAMARMETGERPDVTYLMDICERYSFV